MQKKPFNTIKIGTHHFDHDLFHASITENTSGWTCRKGGRKAILSGVTKEDALEFLKNASEEIERRDDIRNGTVFLQGLIRTKRILPNV